MLFSDYTETGVIYHIVSITDLDYVLKNGISYNDKVTYKTKYYEFHKCIEKEKPLGLPLWVIRTQGIFASMNFPKDHKFHSHSAILGVRINEERCWVANENCANEIYEPFVLQRIEEFSTCSDYLNSEGKELLKTYWNTSLSFKENLKKRLDKVKGYDGEVLIFHDINPEDIKIEYIISDHRMMTIEEWKERFCVIEK